MPVGIRLQFKKLLSEFDADGDFNSSWIEFLGELVVENVAYCKEVLTTSTSSS